MILRRTKYSMCSAILLYILYSAADSFGSSGAVDCISCTASSRTLFGERILASLLAGSESRAASAACEAGSPAISEFDEQLLTVQVKSRLQTGYCIAGIKVARVVVPASAMDVKSGCRNVKRSANNEDFIKSSSKRWSR